MSGYGTRAARTALSTFWTGADGFNAQLALKRATLTGAQAANVIDVATYNWHAHQPHAKAAFPYFSAFNIGGSDEFEQAGSRLYEIRFSLTLLVLNKMHGGNVAETLAALDDYADAARDLVDRRTPTSVGSILGDDTVAGRVLEFRLGPYEVVADPSVGQPHAGVRWPSANVIMTEDY